MSQNTTAPRERACKSTPRTGVGLGGTDVHTVYNDQKKRHRYGLSL